MTFATRVIYSVACMVWPERRIQEDCCDTMATHACCPVASLFCPLLAACDAVLSARSCTTLAAWSSVRQAQYYWVVPLLLLAHGTHHGDGTMSCVGL